MKTELRQSAAALAAALLALTAPAQSEQWLVYHTSAEPKSYRWLDLSTNPPPNVALPAGLKPGAWFGYWTNGLDATGGRVFCLDATRRGAVCDRLYFDTNGDGSLSDETPIGAARRESTVANFPPVKVLFKGEDGPITYHLVPRLYAFPQSRVRLLMGSGGWYEGSIKVGGKQHRVQLIDNTVNAVFNDVNENPYESDRLSIYGNNNDRYLGRYFELDGDLFQIEVARDGAFIRIQPAQNVETGTVHVPQNISEFVAYGPNGHFIRRPTTGELTLPAGKYRVHGWTIERDAEGTNWKLSGYGFGEAAGFEVSVDKPVSLDIGEPVQTAMTFRESGIGGSFDLKLRGSLGEAIQIMRGDSTAPAPRLEFASDDGSHRSSSTFEYG